MKHSGRIISMFAIMALSAVILAAQQTRSITSDDFTSARPTAVFKAGAKVTRRPVAFKFVRKDMVPKRWKSSVNRPASNVSNLPVATADLGVTIWKLRKPLKTDRGAKLPVKVASGIEMWSSERVPLTYTFSANDKIRIGVESPTAGYLYVINSEMGSDGSLGDPFLIFPSPVEQYNWVGPGMVVDIPDQHEPNPYFNMSPKKDTYSGEMLAVVISPEPLKFKVDVKGKIVDLENVLDLESNINVEVFSRTDKTDKVYTQSEAAASCGSASRQLERDAPKQKPCGSASRSLTRDEPPPQSIYRVTTHRGKPAVAFIRLNVR